MNFNNLPDEIKYKIYQYNKHIDKHEKLLKKCFNELELIKNEAIQYIGWIIDCSDGWEQIDDYEYWINLQYRDKKDRKYFLSKAKLIKLLIKLK